jgi:hypothetical protein
MGKLKHIPRNYQYISETHSKEKLAEKKKSKTKFKADRANKPEKIAKI